MTDNENIIPILRDGLNKLSVIRPVRDFVRVTTHCMYPSNGLVSVAVRAGRETAVVSDEGAAISEAASAGVKKFSTDSYLTRLVAPQGLIVKNGVVYSPPVPHSSMHVAVLLVANGSKQVAEWLYQNAKLRIERDFKAAVAQVLALTFTTQLNHKIPISGKRRSHTFANVVFLPNERKLIVDAVAPDPSSISNRAIEHLDVRQNEDPTILQRIIYDDEVEWTPENLNMLGISDVPIIAFSKSKERLSDIGNRRS